MPRKSSAKKSSSSGVLKNLLNFVVWLTGIIVALSVGFAMIGGTLSVPYWLGGSIVSMIAGWIVIVATFVGVLSVIFGK